MQLDAVAEDLRRRELGVAGARGQAEPLARCARLGQREGDDALTFPRTGHADRAARVLLDREELQRQPRVGQLRALPALEIEGVAEVRRDLPRPGDHRREDPTLTVARLAAYQGHHGGGDRLLRYALASELRQALATLEANDDHLVELLDEIEQRAFDAAGLAYDPAWRARAIRRAPQPLEPGEQLGAQARPGLGVAPQRERLTRRHDQVVVPPPRQRQRGPQQLVEAEPGGHRALCARDRGGARPVDTVGARRPGVQPRAQPLGQRDRVALPV